MELTVIIVCIITMFIVSLVFLKPKETLINIHYWICIFNGDGEALQKEFIVNSDRVLAFEIINVIILLILAIFAFISLYFYLKEK